MLGSILVKVAFVSTLVSCFAYLTTSRKQRDQYLSLARLAYSTAVALVLSFCALMLYFILTHQFQYTYIWNYSSTDLPTPLLVSTFYAGQEGSFSLWALYTTIIGVAGLPDGAVGAGVPGATAAPERAHAAKRILFFTSSARPLQPPLSPSG